MSRDEIIRITREAGGFDATPEFLERFAALVAAAERRNCVDTLCEAGQAAQEDDPEWAEIAFWCCSRINNPAPTDPTLASNYIGIDRARGQA